MSNVLRRLFRRADAPATPALDAAIPAIEAAPARAAKDSKPIFPNSDEETVERQIASLLSAWDKTSLCARREFLTRIDQRIMTIHWIRTARDQLTSGAAVS